MPTFQNRGFVVLLQLVNPGLIRGKRRRTAGVLEKEKKRNRRKEKGKVTQEEDEKEGGRTAEQME